MCLIRLLTLSILVCGVQVPAYAECLTPGDWSTTYRAIDLEASTTIFTKDTAQLVFDEMRFHYGMPPRPILKVESASLHIVTIGNNQIVYVHFYNGGCTVLSAQATFGSYLKIMLDMGIEI